MLQKKSNRYERDFRKQRRNLTALKLLWAWDDVSDATLRKWFTSFTTRTGEEITHVQMYADTKAEYDMYAEFDFEVPQDWAVAPFGTVFTYENLPDEVLDYEFYDGYGSASAPCVIAWSDSYLIYIKEYDGAQNIAWFPRFPEQFKLQNKFA